MGQTQLGPAPSPADDGVGGAGGVPMLLLMSLAFAAAPPAALDKAAYAARYPLHGATDRDYAQVLACLDAWGTHPFATPESREFRVVESAVRVMGFGSTEVVDDVATSYPQLIVMRPNVSVLTRTTWKLHNPNGWYCFDTTVAVLARGVVELGCTAHLADGQAAVNVLSTSERAGGVAVVGSLEVQREAGCP